MSKQTKRVTKNNPKKLSREAKSTDSMNPVWVFTNIDTSGDFAFNIHRSDFKPDLFLEKMIEYSRMSWSLIKQQTHDNGKTKHHYLHYERLSPKATERIRAKQMADDVDAIFSFSFNNTVRIIGIRKNEFFKVIWYDPHHEFCPSKK